MSLNASSNKCIATSNKCLTSSNNKNLIRILVLRNKNAPGSKAGSP